MELKTFSVDNTTIQVPKNFYTNIMKPTIDYTLATVLIIMLLPLFLLISLLIVIDSEGPIIFKQPRIGKNGVKFQIYKFRTMYANVPSQGRSPENNNDPRVTRVGKVLRKTSLDELPQLFNIIKGDMSFVGPRPEQESIVNKYYSSYEMQRFLVKPGITGLWQISKDRTKPIHENLKYDFEYIQKLSFYLDIKILFSTIRVIFKSNTF